MVSKRTYDRILLQGFAGRGGPFVTNACRGQLYDAQVLRGIERADNTSARRCSAAAIAHSASAWDPEFFEPGSAAAVDECSAMVGRSACCGAPWLTPWAGLSPERVGPVGGADTGSVPFVPLKPIT